MSEQQPNVQTGATESEAREPQPQPEPETPPCPTWRDHFKAAVVWPGREATTRENVRIPLDPIHPRESGDRPVGASASNQNPSPVAAMAGAAAGQAARLAREVAEMSQEERMAQAQRLAAGMRPISSDAERLVVRALDFGSAGLSKLADRIERRRRVAAGLPASHRWPD
ncbi:MAG: hypothetical protein ACR2J8_06765 [Thermomicrobiales bacterium]